MHLAYPAVLAVLLFCVGLYGVLARRNAILVLMSVELMLNAVNLNLVAFDVWLRDALHAGQALTLFTIAIAAAEIGIGLAIVLAVYRNRGTSAVDDLRDTAERPGDDPGDGPGPDGGHGPGDGPGTGGATADEPARTGASASRTAAAAQQASASQKAEATA
ncbi:NADH-quinone oxidoreductase subunit NuoK [Streptomyces sp. p1417]|uniref:NADH-quinone oxidoreductase subunit K n=1 Tax=Streptomyces typhae TaxID=2681492 RepID=A0A6L6WRF6_9ACTN|nr:NADH-quinone oxidoreductase subunit NuoK [Streptomyces typhae]MVO83774.1 NADH-quinone oxidoreductase subunit NuoK [Streptomyces typhae]